MPASRRDEHARSTFRRATTTRGLNLVVDPWPVADHQKGLRDAGALLRRGEPEAAARLLAPLLATPRGLSHARIDESVYAQLRWALAWSGRASRDLRPVLGAVGASPSDKVAHAHTAAELGKDDEATAMAFEIATSTDASVETKVDALHLLGRLIVSRATVIRIAAVADSASGNHLPSAAAVQVAHLRALDHRDGQGLEDVAARFHQIDHLALAHEAMTQAATMHLLTGSPRHAGRCRGEAEFMATAGIRPTFAARRAVEQLPLLTRRERAVVGLIGDGRTLREVAAELGCSPRTAESHLQHAYVKLGINDRAALRSLVTRPA